MPGNADATKYPWDRLDRRGAKVLIRSPKRSARIAASAYAGRHGFAISMAVTKTGNLLVQRV
jgi:hypothetical protein